MHRVSCDQCGGKKLSYIEKTLMFKCENCGASFRDPEWSKEIQDRSTIKTSLGSKKPVVINTGDGNVSITFVGQSHLPKVGLYLGIIASTITIARFTLPYIIPLFNEDVEFVNELSRGFFAWPWFLSIMAVALIVSIALLVYKNKKQKKKQPVDVPSIENAKEKSGRKVFIVAVVGLALILPLTLALPLINRGAPPPARATAPAGMVRVGGGTKMIGGRNVTLSTFNMARHLVMQGEWYDLMGTRPSHFTGTNWRSLPVEGVSWFDAIEFANAKSHRASLTPAYTISGTQANRTVTWNRGANGYRLPTEAEWEFAARGGMVCRGNYEFSGSNTVGTVAWYMGNSGGGTQPVGMLRPNALGIYDMSGNVWEWVWDPVRATSGSNRVLRGGSWVSTSANARSADRNGTAPSNRNRNIGFRLVRP